MADSTLSGLPVVPSVNAALEVYGNNGGASAAATAQQISDFVAAELGFSGSSLAIDTLTVNTSLIADGPVTLNATSYITSSNADADTFPVYGTSASLIMSSGVHELLWNDTAGHLQLHRGRATGRFALTNETASGDAKLIEVNGGVASTMSFYTGFGTETLTLAEGLVTTTGAGVWNEQAAPAVSAAGTGRIYFDVTDKIFKASEDGGAYIDLIGGAGGTSPGGLNTHVQFNDGGAFGGVAAFTFDKTTGALSATTFNGVALTTAGAGTDFLSADGTYKTVAGGGELQDVGAGTRNLGTTDIDAFGAGTVAAGAQDNLAIGYQASYNLNDGDYGIAIGYQAGYTARSTLAGVVIGYRAGFTGWSFNTSVVIGSQACENIAGGIGYIAIGQRALSDGSRSDDMIAIGAQSMRYGRPNTTIADASIAIGRLALRGSATTADNTGISNLAMGYGALYQTSTGSGNIGIGANVGPTLVSGDYNTLLGNGADTIAAGSGGIALGYNMALTASYQLAIGYNNNAVISAGGIDNLATATLTVAAGGGTSFTGHIESQGQAAPAVSGAGDGRIYFDSGTNTYQVSENGGAYTALVPGSGGELALSGTGTDNLGTTGLNSFGAILAGAVSNIGIGRDSLAALTDGDYNIGIGEDTLDSVTTGSRNVTIGNDAGQTITTGDSNIGIGDQALSETSALTTRAVIIGPEALDNGGTSRANYLIAIGSKAVRYGRVCTSAADSSIGIGTEAMSGSALDYLLTGTSNIGIGYRSLYTVANGSDNIGIGGRAGDSLKSGSDNIFIGTGAGGNTTIGSNNVGIGSQAIASVTTNGSNTAVGHRALEFITTADNTALGYMAGSTTTSGSKNTFIGANTGSLLAAAGGSIVLGANTTAIGSNQLVIGVDNHPVFEANGIDVTSTATLDINAGGGVKVDGGLTGTYQTLASSASITADFSGGNNFNLTLADNTALENPTGVNASAGQSGVIAITQDGIGSRTMAFGTYWEFAGGSAPTLSTAAGATDLLVWHVIASTRIVAQLIADVS